MLKPFDLVKAIHFEDGQRVAKGQLLVELENAEEESRLVEAKALLVERTAAHERAVELRAQGISPASEVQSALAQMHAAQARVTTLNVTVRDHAVRAPFAGMTRAYQSPEIAAMAARLAAVTGERQHRLMRDAATLTPRGCDVYAFGVTLLELALGAPFASPGCGGLTISPTAIWPITFEQRPMETSLSSCACTSGAKPCSSK